MQDFFKELVEYSHHYNQKLWSMFKENPEQVSEKSVKLYSHILNAHHIWNARIESRQPSYGVWDVQIIDNCKGIDQKNYEDSLRILLQRDLNENIFYSNTRGEKFEQSIRDILFHVVNHSTYHRAQIATECKQNGLEPLTTDYIFYKRQQR